LLLILLLPLLLLLLPLLLKNVAATLTVTAEETQFAAAICQARGQIWTVRLK
jgi:hypothetical protein